jgi:hypothetical protein
MQMLDGSKDFRIQIFVGRARAQSARRQSAQARHVASNGLEHPLVQPWRVISFNERGYLHAEATLDALQSSLRMFEKHRQRRIDILG